MKKLQKEITAILEAFASNSYLVPSKHTDLLPFTNSDERYRTYSGTERRYLSIEIYKDGEEIWRIVAHKHLDEWDIGAMPLFKSISVTAQLKTHHKYLQMIYDEIHSLNPDKNRLKEIREEIEERREKVKCEQKHIERLKQEIADSTKISPKE